MPKSPLLLAALLLFCAAEPSLAAACRPRMSPLQCLFSSLHQLRAPPQARTARRHAARQRRVRAASVSHARGRATAALPRRAGRGLKPSETRPTRADAAAPIPPLAREEPAVSPGAPATSSAGAPVAAAAMEAAKTADVPDIGEPAETPSAGRAPVGRPAPLGRPTGVGATDVRPTDMAGDGSRSLAATEPRDSVAAIRRLFGLPGAPPADDDGLVGATAGPEVALRALPPEFLSLRPDFAELRYFLAHDRVLFVLPATRRIVLSY